MKQQQAITTHSSQQVQLRPTETPISNSITNILAQLSYPAIHETCLLCLKQIQNKSFLKQCLSCKRNCHLQCFTKSTNKPQCQIQFHQMNIDYQCPSCTDFNTCFSCKNYLDDSDYQIYSCSICQLKVHQRCHFIPKEIMLNQYTDSDQKEQACCNYDYLVCSTCIDQFGVRQVKDRVMFHSKEYIRVSLKHPSPIHSTWLEASMLLWPQQEEQQQKTFLITNHQIQIIFSMHVPEMYNNLTIEEIEYVICNNFIRRRYKPINTTFKFLTKWKKCFESFVWEQQRVFYNNKAQIIKFLHKLKMNSIVHLNSSSTHPTLLKRCIRTYANNYNILQKINLPHHITNTNNADLLFIDDKVSSLVSAKIIYKFYKLKKKQKVRLINMNSKVSLVCCLVNTIYFHDYIDAPCKVNSWINYLLIKAPFLTTVALVGHQSYHLFVIHQEECIYRFNILIISYESLITVSTLLNLKNIIAESSLLIFDQNITPLAFHFYSQATGIARITFLRQKQIVLQASGSTKPQGSSQNLKKSSLTVSANKSNQVSTNDGNNRMSWSNIRQNYLDKEDRHVSEVNRLVVLRHFIMFGVDGQDRVEIVNKLIHTEEEQVCLQKINNYLTYFFIALRNLYQEEQSTLHAAIISHFFFNVQPKYIYKIIVSLSRIRKFCCLYENDPSFKSNLKIPFSNTANKLQYNCKWQNRFDYIFCKYILIFGFGQWHTISQLSINWEQDESTITLMELLHNMTQGELIEVDFCSQFLAMRIKDIIRYMQNMQV